MTTSTRLGLVYLMVVVLLSSLVTAQTIDISIHSSLDQGETQSVNYSVFATSPFDGIIDVGYSRITSTLTSLAFSSSSFVGQYLNGTFTITGQGEGTYTIQANVSNLSTTFSSVTKTGQVTSAAPSVLLALPTGVQTETDVKLTVQTDEDATCKFDTTDHSYLNMGNTFDTTGTNFHNHSLTGLSQGAYRYYVKCKNNAGYEMNNSGQIDFSVDLPPTASIDLNDPTPVKAGTLEITLTISEALDDTPSLSYQYDGDSAVSIPLVGSGDTWTGFLVITESQNNRIGSFKFSATDSAGNTGTTLTEGNVFVVDTQKPGKPNNLKTTLQSSGKVDLEWYYDGEEVDYFNIYRSTTEGVTFVDKHATGTDQFLFADTDTSREVTYYYRVTAVDLAGNEGELSDEIFATIEEVDQPKTISQEIVSEQTTLIKEDKPEKTLPPLLVPKVNNVVKDAERIRLDVEDAIKQLSKDQTDAVKELSKNLGIEQALEQAQSNLEKKKTELNELKLRYMTEDELDQVLADYERDLLKIETSTPAAVEILEHSEFDQSLGKEDVPLAVEELLVNSPLSEEEKKSYIKLNNKYVKKLPVQVSAKIITITNLDGSTEDHTFISKFISYTDATKLTDVNVIEFIPKTVAAHVDDISFITDQFSVLEEDPIVKFSFLDFNYQGETISYTIADKVDIEDIKLSRTVPLVNLNQDTSSAVTGFSILDGFSLSGTQSWLMKLGIGMVVVLFLYYMVVTNGIDLSSIMNRTRRPESSAYSAQASSRSTASTYDMPSEDAHTLLSNMHQEIGTAKKEMADKLIPLMMNMHSTLENHQEKMKEVQTIQHMLNQAHGCADAGQIENAKTLYKRIQLAYPLLPSHAKKGIFEQCKQLHQKIR